MLMMGVVLAMAVLKAVSRVVGLRRQVGGVCGCKGAGVCYCGGDGGHGGAGVDNGEGGCWIAASSW